MLKDVKKIRYDIVNAVMSGHSLNIWEIYAKVKEISKVVTSPSARHLIILHKRLKNIIRKAPVYDFAEKLLKEKEEKFVYDVFKELKPQIEKSLEKHDYLSACSQLLEMKPLIDSFFDKVLVMVKDEKLKKNRIALIQNISNLMLLVADFSILSE